MWTKDKIALEVQSMKVGNERFHTLFSATLWLTVYQWIIILSGNDYTFDKTTCGQDKK